MLPECYLRARSLSFFPQAKSRPRNSARADYDVQTPLETPLVSAPKALDWSLNHTVRIESRASIGSISPELRCSDTDVLPTVPAHAAGGNNTRFLHPLMPWNVLSQPSHEKRSTRNCSEKCKFSTLFSSYFLGSLLWTLGGADNRDYGHDPAFLLLL